MICKCGHPEEEHIYGEQKNLCGDCLIVEKLDFDGIIQAYTHTFVPDNLNTIEQEAKKRNLI